jgi:formylglycine-generating enzyme required for sulfatase activity
MSWLDPEDQELNYVSDLKHRDGESDQLLYRLLLVLSLALRIEPLLLRNARLRFTPNVDLDFETTIWFSDVMHTRNAQACVMRGGIARALADELASNPAEFETAWRFVEDHSRHWPPQERLEQELRLAARTEDSIALQQGFKRILQTLLLTEDADVKRDLSRWIKGAMPSLIKSDETSEMAHLLFQYTAAALGLPSSWSNKNAPDKVSMPQWLIDALPQNRPSALGIQLRPGLLECLKPDPNLARHILEVKLPLPTPVLITVNDNGKGYWESLWIGKKICLYRQVKTLSLQTLDGQIYRFTVPAETEDASANDTETSYSALLAYMPNEIEQARRIAKLLRQYDIDVELVEDRKQQASSSVASVRPVLRLWSRAASDYWQNNLSESRSVTPLLPPGLLLRTDPDTALPDGADFPQFFQYLDWQPPQDLEVAEGLARQVLQWIQTGKLRDYRPDETTSDTASTANQKQRKDEGSDVEQEIQDLLNELGNPEIRPRRRLEIGDRLAELGDPRPGVGVREYEIAESEEDIAFEAHIEEIYRLIGELNNLKTEPPRRLEIGNRLAELGDLRPGVGLDENRLPDIDWVEIPAGAFVYGEKGEERRLDLERFYIGRYPITNVQYQTFIEAGGYQDERWWQDLIKPKPKKPSWKQPNRPRETVNWYEAVAFTRWLSAQLGYTITLPTEAQWEKAARGDNGRDYPWGNRFQSGDANAHEVPAGKKDNLRQTTAVGMYMHRQSSYGVADMAGNVWEWCLNKYHEPAKLEPDDSGDVRVLRGGSWYDDPELARSASRSRNNPDDRYFNIGFRVVSSSPHTER